MAATAEAIANPYTHGVAEFVANVRYEDIPADVRHRLKLLMLDALGAGLYGAQLEWSRILRDTLGSVDATRTCRVWGTPHRLGAPHAALCNGTQVQGFELDDVHRYGVLHVGAVTLPPLLALLEERPAITGREFLAAAVCGYEVGPRVGMCMGPDHIAQGWHSGATVGVFSAAAAAARLLRLDTEQTVHALGIAGTQAAGLMAAQFGAMVKRMHAGRSAQSGLYGALLAANGFTGIQAVFESEYGGFASTFSRSHDRFNLDELTSGLGKRWETMRVSLKFYSCVMSNHTTLDAIRQLRAEHPFGPDDVEKITVHAAYVTVEHAGWRYVPNGMTAAQLNLGFCVATLLIDGDVFVDQFTDDAIVDPRKLALAERVDVVEDTAITAMGREKRHTVRVEVTLKDGTRLEAHVEAQRGSDLHFASDADIIEKFEKMAAKALPARQVEALRTTVLELDDVEDVRRLAELLAPS